MRQNIKDFATFVSKTLQLGEPIYEFGSLQVPGQIGFSDLRPIFAGMTYVGCDMRLGPGVDKVIDLHAIELAAESVGTALCFDTLEHVEYPREAIAEIHRVLKPNGIAVISSVMCFPIHDFPHDYWRFTPEAFRSLLKHFSSSFVGFQGEETFPHTVIGVGFKGEVPDLAKLELEYRNWRAREPKPRRITQYALKVTPPVLVPALRKAYRFAAKRLGSAD